MGDVKTTFTRYFVHHRSDCAWREPSCSESEANKILADSCGGVDEVTKEIFLNLIKLGYSIDY